jgi:hypothetical protein
MDFRLIHTRTLKLELFNEPRIPKYAILSHTWTDDEVSYEEMIRINGESSHPAARKSGYLKICGTCEKARSHGIEYAWVDTCCINRSRSEELTEAINSMFRWYRRADACFVYFADLSSNSDIVHSMPRCRWFTRGWCLQELIAPRDVMFYNNCWQHIGNKSTPRFEKLISHITKIDQAVLSDASLLPRLSVAQKMSWASRRVTTRPEDIAYCLLGIFNINMPLLYGEGQKAFLRLQKEIIEQSNDLSIFAWGHPISTSPPGHEQDGPTAPDEDDAKSYSTDPDSYCDLFAQSPSDFSGCGNLVLPHDGAFRNLAFSMTNNGLSLSQMDLRLNFDNNCSLLPLLCHDENSPTEPLYLVLKMIHARLYVRLRQCRSGDLFQVMSNERVDGYVLTHLTPQTRSRIASSHISSVQLRSQSSRKSVLHESILEISSPDTWDASRLAFLNCDDRLFMGYCKLNGRTLCQDRLGSESLECDYFYLSWGRLLLSNISDTRSRDTVWVRLYSREAWKRSAALRGPIHINADVNQASELETHQLRLTSIDVKVRVISIEELGRRFFRIDINTCST